MTKTSRTLINACAALVGVAGTAAAFEGISRLRWGRSGVASAWAGLQRACGGRADLLGRDLGRFEDYVERHRIENEREYRIPAWLPLSSLVFEETCDGMKTYHLGTTGKNDRAVLYLHGGAYIEQVAPRHWLFADQLCQATGAEVCVPVYPLAPAHDYDEAYSLVIDLYEGMVERHGADNVILMGDGAGGGLAAGVVETFVHYDLPQPAQLILVSPELDITMRNPDIHAYFDLDPQLAPWGIAQVGDIWADGDDATAPRLSPINGDVSILRNVTTFVGGREILRPDCVLWDQRLQEAGVTHRLVLREGLGHAWPLAPIPEARGARRLIADIVRSGASWDR